MKTAPFQTARFFYSAGSSVVKSAVFSALNIALRSRFTITSISIRLIPALPAIVINDSEGRGKLNT